MSRKEDKRFIDLTVKEVSLVDNPANEEEWIVIKSMSMEDEMAEEKKPIEAEVEKKELEDKVETKEDIVEKSEPEVEKEAKAEVEKKELEDKVETKEDIVEKSEPEVEEKPSLLQSLAAEVQEIEKAKRFTNNRTESLVKATKEMLSTLNSVSPNIVQQLVSEFRVIEEPETVEKEEKIEKTFDQTELLNKVDEIVKKAIEPIVDRVDKIEKFRGVSKSVVNEDNETADIKKTDEIVDLWAGFARR
jgi:hypothetical protein